MAKKHKRQKKPIKRESKTLKIIFPSKNDVDVLLANGDDRPTWKVSESTAAHILEEHCYHSSSGKSRFHTDSYLTLIGLLSDAIEQGGISCDEADSSKVLYVKMEKHVGITNEHKTKWMAIRYHYEEGGYRVRTAYPCRKPLLP